MQALARAHAPGTTAFAARLSALVGPSLQLSAQAVAQEEAMVAAATREPGGEGAAQGLVAEVTAESRLLKSVLLAGHVDEGAVSQVGHTFECKILN